MENVRNHRDIKFVTTTKRRNKFASERNYYATKYFSEKLLVIKLKKRRVKMNQPVYLGMAILDIRKIAMYHYWNDYVKPNYG